MTLLKSQSFYVSLAHCLNKNVIQLLETKELILTISSCVFTGIILNEAESCKKSGGE